MTARRRRLMVRTDAAGCRLDQFLAARLSGHSRSFLQKLIRDGRVTLLDATGGADRREPLLRARRAMKAGETVEVVIPEPEPSLLVPEPIELSILHEDEDLLVIDKQPGIVVHPGAGARRGTLVHALLHHGPRLSIIGGVERPGIVHRLDKETSGVMVVAKNDAAHRELTRQFQTRAVRKVYAALVWGSPRRAAGSIDLAIGRDRRQRVKISPRTASPRDAFTEYRVAETLGGFSWLEVRPRTGRTHQIRVHLSHLGHPVVGDTLYGGGRLRHVTDPAVRAALARFGRLALHARRLDFVHPATRLSVSYEAPLPADLVRLLEALREASRPATRIS